MNRDDVLRGPLAKLARAERHLGEFRHAVEAWFNDHTNLIVCQMDLQAGRAEYYVRGLTEIPDHVPLILGDAAHNARAALDHLACQLVLAGGGPVSPDTAFPIPRDASKVPTWPKLVQDKLRGAAKEVVSSVLEIQPYPGGDHEDLFTLHRLDIADKHWLLPVMATTNESVDLDLGSGMITDATAGTWVERSVQGLRLTIRPADRRVNDGDLIFSQPIHERHTHPNFTFDVSLDQTTIGTLPGVGNLDPAVHLMARLIGTARRTVIDLAARV